MVLGATGMLKWQLKKKKAKTIHRELLSKHLLQINFKLTNTLGAGEWEWLMETGKSTTASSGRTLPFFCICNKYRKTVLHPKGCAGSLDLLVGHKVRSLH